MEELPSGTVTFLFTDIEGSTALWERDRKAMAAAVERHLALLRSAIDANDGVLFKTVGDAVQAAFPTALPDTNAGGVRLPGITSGRLESSLTEAGRQGWNVVSSEDGGGQWRRRD